MTRQQKLRLTAPAALIILAVIGFLTSRSGHSAATSPVPTPTAVLAPVAADPILEVDATMLTSFLAAKTVGQDIKPGVDFRGVDLDGRLRKGSALGMHVAANPYGPFPPGTQSLGGVALMNGAVTQEDVDLAFPADGPRWVIGRTYNSRQDGGAVVSDGFQGKNWFQTAQPEIQLVEIGEEEESLKFVYLFYGADRFIELRPVPESQDTYKATNGAVGAIVHTVNSGISGAPDTWRYTDGAGWHWTFFGFDSNAAGAEGQIWKIEAPSGETAYIGDASLANDPITLGYPSGNILHAYDSEDRMYTFGYTGSRLTSVVVQTKTGGTWPSSPTGLKTIGSVEYEYYSSAPDDYYGQDGDLKRVTVSTLINSDTNQLVTDKHYRYWEPSGSQPPLDPHGPAHCLQYVIDAEGARRADLADNGAFDQSYLAVADLSSYASAYFEYDGSKRCVESSEESCGGCGGGSAHGTVLFTYEANGSFAPIAGYNTEWARRALAQRADGSFATQYFDEVGQALSSLITDATPASGTPSKWVTEVQRNSDGVTTQVATPAAVTAYTHSTGAVTSANTAGLIRYWTLETTGETKGFAKEQTYNRDKNSSKYLEWSRTFAIGSLVVGDTTVYRPLVDDERDYPVAITSGTTGSNLTTRTHTWHSGTLSPKEIAVTWPTVTTANNGPNSATSSRVWLDAVGRAVWTQAEDGVINYIRYSGGLVTMSIRDADTTLTASMQVFNGLSMPGWTLGSGPFHRIDESSYDDGFQRTLTQADGRTRVSYASVLSDRRMVALSYPDFDGTAFHGPVEFRVANHAGRIEASCCS